MLTEKASMIILNDSQLDVVQVESYLKSFCIIYHHI